MIEKLIKCLLQLSHYSSSSIIIVHKHVLCIFCKNFLVCICCCDYQVLNARNLANFIEFFLEFLFGYVGVSINFLRVSKSIALERRSSCLSVSFVV